ncbi:cystathionine gamma-synthase [Fragilariopsis cylindrus CCMP1102]|uniref:cystathionine gamma-lyase n=1 Tax=Fragilariopsis cylindrus CCMP1102 TaxID=635003 RepID=A0A1E7F093_9STRA|nr:cystathionine gamma-synthase [Fragilariopsis cylindrus CCMP1102]|eukprot:OEU11611.1 cystathionine gamma-synthase [Fragilariopsis cylindrus CCMP1102]
MATILSHAGITTTSCDNSGEERENHPMSPPLHTATTYTRPPDGIYKDSDSIYARMDNPTRLLLEKNIFDLECTNLLYRYRKNKDDDDDEKKRDNDDNGTRIPLLPLLCTTTTTCYSSGMQAVTSILLAHSSSPTNMTVLIPTDVYHGVRSLLSGVFSRHGIHVRGINMSSSGGNEEDIHNHDHNHDLHNIIVWMETPSNPKCEVVDIKTVCDKVRSVGERWKNVIKITTVVDGTMSSPVLTRPLELGADISFHSGTKYLAGHSDALIGTVTVSPTSHRGRTLHPLIKAVQISSGGVASPWDSWLTLRGMRTLHLRVERQCQSAMKLADYLEEKRIKTTISGVWAVHYPGLPSHPQHDVATKQMNNGYGGVLSFELEDEIAATAFAGAVRIAQRATSLGGTETLIEHRASIEPPDQRTSPPGLLRVSVGLEDVNDLIHDFDTAFAIVKQVLSSSSSSSSG